MRAVMGLLVLAVLCFSSGCRSVPRDTKEGVERSDVVAAERRRVMLIPDYSAPEIAEAAMKRPPDAIQRDGTDEVHYYLIQGAVEGEALRLVYRDSRLIGRSVVKTRPSEFSP
ncbi:MAG: hypothetical protein AMXMBFR7_31430 [Planctomycetota bacterium]